MKSNGYSLVEVLISLSIVGLLFSFGFVSFRDFSRRQHLTSVARSIKGELRLIQSKAISGEKPDSAGCIGVNTLTKYNFQLIDTSSYQIVAVCSGGNIQVKSETVPSDIIISSTLDPISFKVLGQGTNIVSGTNAVITLTQEGTGNVATVTVSDGGEIK